MPVPVVCWAIWTERKFIAKQVVRGQEKAVRCCFYSEDVTGRLMESQEAS